MTKPNVAQDPLAGTMVLPGDAEGRIVATEQALSFWGGVDPVTGRVIDAHHPLHGVRLTGAILLMPTSRGSCSGSGVLLDMIQTGRAPAALVFREHEDVLTLGALVASAMFERSLPVLRLSADGFRQLSQAKMARIGGGIVEADSLCLRTEPQPDRFLRLTASDEAIREGATGEAAKRAMQIICTMAIHQGAEQLVDVTQVHIDGCIYASDANLIFAERMADLGARVLVPTTMNAISVDHANWRAQGVPPSFGLPAARLADAYVRMGCRPTFTCAPYLLDTAPRAGEFVAWAESNAVIFVNSVLGARTAKHPDFLDLCIALTGRAPLAGAYLDAGRKACRVIDVDWPEHADDAIWPLIGYLAGQVSPDRIPLLRGLASSAPSHDSLRAMCAAFGTTSAAPMIHVEGVTPEADGAASDDADHARITPDDLVAAWTQLNDGPADVDLVAFGSPHASLSECHAIADAFAGRRRRDDVAAIITCGASVLAEARRDGTLRRLEDSGVQLVTDLCWCSISEPVFPPHARTVITNSGKYAHYGPGLSGRTVRFASLSDCVTAALAGSVPPALPRWLRRQA